MAEVTPPPFLQESAYTARLDRQAMSSMLGYEGVCSPTDLAVTTPGGMDVSISSGQAFVLGDNSALQHYYSIHNNGAKTLTLDPSTGSPRTDVIAAFVEDNAEDSSGFNRWRIVILKGTAGVGAPVPTIPNNHLPLAKVLVGAGVGNVVGQATDMRVLACYRGGVAQRPFLSPPPNAHIGQEYFDLGLGHSLYYFGPTTGWRPSWPTAWGIMGAPQTLIQTGPGIVGSVVVVNNSALTKTFVANRRYKFTLHCRIRTTVNFDVFRFYLQKDGGAAVGGANGFETPPLLAGLDCGVDNIMYDAPTPGAHTYQWICDRGAGTGSGTIEAANGFVVIEDIGPAAAPVLT